MRKDSQPIFDPSCGSDVEVAQALIEGLLDELFTEDWLRGNRNLYFSRTTSSVEADAIRERTVARRAALVARLREAQSS